MEKEKLLDIKDLSVTYKTEDGIVYAVNNLNLTLEPKETLGFVGETGAGKTTTAMTIMGLLPTPPGKVTSGEIMFDGKDMLKIGDKERRGILGEKISMIFQDPMTSLNPSMKVGDQIVEMIRLHKVIGKKEAFEEACGLLEMVGIRRERANDYPHQFSGGMKQRVVIAIALAFLMTVLMLMAVTFLMPVAFLMAVTIFMAVTILMTVTIFMTVAFLMTMLMLLQMHIKIKCIQTAHNLPSKMQMVSIHSQALQRILQHLPVRSQIKQGSYRHIPADARITFQI